MKVNFKKILVSLFTIGAVVGLGMLTTNAFFNDTETSSGNLLQAGALDLKVDNTCYYNGRACLPSVVQGVSTWGGDDPREGGEQCSCTWTKKDLVSTDLFFNLNDLKPGDTEEDTISLHVDNPSWLCVNAYLTKNDDNTCTSPELADDPTCNEPNQNLTDGELAQNLNFVFWRDDGDNVLETDETVIQSGQGPASTVLNSSWPLADSSTGQPLPANEEVFVGKAFCFGEMTLTPVAADQGENPTVDSGVTCDGSEVDNAAQTDLANATLSFQAVQARHNDAFRCERPATPTAITATVTPLPTQ